METREQTIAGSFDRNLAVTANAGSGKTSVLVNRYVGLILSGIHPKEILAITFTRKAASEMLARVIRKIDDINKRKDATPEELKKISIIRDSMTDANISTIHSFCSNLLREYPIESNIDPNFSELSKADKLLIINNSITSVLEEWIEDNEPAKKAKSSLVFDMLGHFKIESILKDIINQAELFPELKYFYRQNTPEKIIKKRDEFFAKTILPDIKNGLDGLIQVLNEIETAKLSPEQVEELSDATQMASGLLTEIKYLYEKYEFGNIKSILNKSLDIISNKKFLNKSITFDKRTYLKKIKNELIRAKADNFISGLQSLPETAKTFEYENYESEFIDLVLTILEIAKEVFERIEEEKLSLGAIDFDDMLIKTYYLLQRQKVKDELWKKHKYIMVDEFQDTNHLQYSMVKALIPALNNSSAEKDVNLFIVGDYKQSIYGFRNADVRVFTEAKNDIINSNEKKLKSGLISNDYQVSDNSITSNDISEALGDVKLSASFRLQPVVAAFVNRVCGRSMSENQSIYSVPYEPLICARNVKEIFNSPDDLDVDRDGYSKIQSGSSGYYGSIRFIISGLYDNGKNEKEPEHELLAKFIKRTIKSDKGFQVQDGDVFRNAKYSDVTILGRSRNGFDNLISSFQKYDIPYILHSGSGFFNSQEIIDLCSYLKFLHNNQNDIVLAGILKSPFFNLTDTQLFKISKQKGYTSLWKKLELFVSNLKNMPTGNDNIVIRAFSILSNTNKFASRISISQLLIKILEESGWYGLIGGNPARSQMIANLEKMIQYARDFENSGFKNLFDFVEELKLLSEAGKSEGEAVFLTGEDAVNIMTIHASKGLEFPIVVLYNTNKRQGSSNNSSIISRELGLTFSYPAPIKENNTLINVDTPLHYLNKKNRNLADEAEEKRVLYVALTRAKDHLIISGDLRDNPKGFMESILSSLDVSKDNMASIISNNIETSYERLNRSHLELSEKLNLLDGVNLFERIINFQVEIITNCEIVSTPKDVAQYENAREHYLMDDINSKIENVYYSATRLMSYDKDKESYFLKYRIGLPFEGEIDDSTKLDSDNSTEIDSLFFGSLIHKVLERIKTWFNESGFLSEEFHDTLNQIISESGRFITDEIKKRIENECRSVVSTNLIRNHIRELINAEFEKSLIIPWVGDFLTGVLDVLILNSNGEYEIWDWKSNRLESPESISSAAESYRIQMQIYSYFIMLLQPEQKIFRTRLLFTHLAKENASDDAWTYYFEWNKGELLELISTIEGKSKEMKEYLYGII